MVDIVVHIVVDVDIVVAGSEIIVVADIVAGMHAVVDADITTASTVAPAHVTTLYVGVRITKAGEAS